MPKHVAFYIVTLPILNEYEAAKSNTKAARAAYWDAYKKAYDDVKQELQKLTDHLPVGERPLLWTDDFLEPQLYIINVKGRALDILKDRKFIGTFSFRPVSV